MRTELPVHLWEKIVDNLPPSPPKFAQTVVLFANDHRDVKLHISKGICVEERDLIDSVPGTSRRWKDKGTHWKRNLAFSEAMNACTSAIVFKMSAGGMNNKHRRAK
jgi:hypothetical protein